MPGYEVANRVYDTEYLAPTIRTFQGGGLQPKFLDIQPKVLGGLGEKKSNGGQQYYQQDRVYSSDGIAMALPAQIPGGSYRYMMVEETVVAERGRGVNNEQQLEERKDGLCNSLTSAQKDNMVLIKQATKEGYIPCEVPGIADLNYVDSKTRRGRVQEGGADFSNDSDGEYP